MYLKTIIILNNIRELQNHLKNNIYCLKMFIRLSKRIKFQFFKQNVKNNCKEKLIFTSILNSVWQKKNQHVKQHISKRFENNKKVYLFLHKNLFSLAFEFLFNLLKALSSKNITQNLVIIIFDSLIVNNKRIFLSKSTKIIFLVYFFLKYFVYKFA